MTRPHARNNAGGGEPSTGLKTLVRKQWVQRRREDVKPLITEMRTAVSTLNDCKPSQVALETHGRIVNLLKKRVVESGTDFKLILADIVDGERTKAEQLTGNTQKRTLAALDAISNTVLLALV
jgi:hypothetical protein